MKYFTPELLTQCRDKDIDRAIDAEDEWERQIQRYQRHYRRIEGSLPESVRRFHHDCCLHDAEVFGPAWLSFGKVPAATQNVCIVTHNLDTLVPEHLNTMIVLQYTLAAPPSVATPVPSGRFHPGHPVWLYDEFDLIEPGVFSHEILLSDGRVVSIRFRQFQYHIAPLVLPTQNGKAARKVKSKKKVVPA